MAVYGSPELRLFSKEFDYQSYPVKLRYCVLSSPRCGSTMTCSALLASRMAGVPFEYLNRKLTSLWAQRSGQTSVDLGIYLGQLEARRTTPNGVFGMKLHYNQWAGFFGNPATANGIEFLTRQDRLILATRSDKIAQATSLAIAKKTGVWNTKPEEGGGDEHLEWTDEMVVPISNALAQVVSEDVGWRQFLWQTRLPHLEVRFENLIADFRVEFRRILAYLDIDSNLAETTIPATRPMGDRKAAIKSSYLAAIGL